MLMGRGDSEEVVKCQVFDFDRFNVLNIKYISTQWMERTYFEYTLICLWVQ